MELREAVRQAVEAFAVLEELGDVAFVPGEERGILFGGVRARLKDAVSERVAWEIADFVPIALARAVLAETGVRFHDHYARLDHRGRLRTYRKLGDEPVYREAEAIAPEVIAQRGDAARKIARRSVEFQQVTAALNAGRNAPDLEPSPPILNGPDDLCDPLSDAPTFTELPWWVKPLGIKMANKPWWRFW